MSRLLQGGFDFCFQLLLTGKNNNILSVLHIVKKHFEMFLRIIRLKLIPVNCLNNN
jgi:hypothetical protein